MLMATTGQLEPLNTDAQRRCVEYVLDVLLGDRRDRVVYGRPEPESSPSDPHLYIIPSSFFPEYGTPSSDPALPLADWKGIPLLFGTPRSEWSGNHLVLHADIVASSYYLLTRYEEYTNPARDAFGRFSGKGSLAGRAGFVERPVVDEYAAQLSQMLADMGYKKPADRIFSVTLSHDVDDVSKFTNPLRTLAGTCLGWRPLSDIAQHLKILSGTAKDPYDNYNDLLALAATAREQASCPVQNEFYFLASRRAHKLDRRYALSSRAAQSVLQDVQTAGATVGLHVSYQAGLDATQISRECQALAACTDAPIRKARYHYLGWRAVSDGFALAAAGITDDSTLGFPDLAGFRLGVCRPVPLFDPASCQLLGITEHPLIAMDRTLRASRYMNLDEESAYELLIRLLRVTQRHNGEFVTLWHNATLADDPWQWRVYTRFVAAL